MGGVNRKLVGGVSIIGCIIPDCKAVAQANGLYAVKPTLVWVNTSLEVADDRLLKSGDGKRIKRVDDELQNEASAAPVKELASVMFEPVYDLAADEASFVEVIRRIVHGDMSVR